MCHAVLFLAFVGILAAPMAAPAVDLEVRGRVVDQSGLPLPGTTVRLAPVAGGAPRLAVTGAEGEYRFLVAPGRYRLIVDLAGFTPVEQDLVVAAAHTIPDIVLSISRFAEETTVVAILETEVQPRSFAAPATLATKVIDNAPVKSNRYEDVLPLVPTVVRGPDGTISIGGARAAQGVVLLNGVPHTDPVNSEADAALPLPAIDTLQVYATGYPAESGRQAAASRPSTPGRAPINSGSP